MATPAAIRRVRHGPAPPRRRPPTCAAPDAVTKPSVVVPTELPTELVITDLITGTGTRRRSRRHRDRPLRGRALRRRHRVRQQLRPWPAASKCCSAPARSSPAGSRACSARSRAAAASSTSPPTSPTAIHRRPAGRSCPATRSPSSSTSSPCCPTSDAADEPEVTVAAAANIAVLQSTDLIVGSGASPVDGQNVADSHRLVPCRHRRATGFRLGWPTAHLRLLGDRATCTQVCSPQ